MLWDWCVVEIQCVQVFVVYYFDYVWIEQIVGIFDWSCQCGYYCIVVDQCFGYGVDVIGRCEGFVVLQVDYYGVVGLIGLECVFGQVVGV